MQFCLISAKVIEEGLPGRTTDLEDLEEPVRGGVSYSGLQHLPTALASHQLLDLVILMLGTNDAKTRFERDAHDIVAGMRHDEPYEVFSLTAEGIVMMVHAVSQ
jgi:lysophospholipase L1-like esterase